MSGQPSQSGAAVRWDGGLSKARTCMFGSHVGVRLQTPYAFKKGGFWDPVVGGDAQGFSRWKDMREGVYANVQGRGKRNKRKQPEKNEASSRPKFHSGSKWNEMTSSNGCECGVGRASIQALLF